MRGLTLRQTAEPARLSPAYLHKLEHGRVKSPSPAVLERLANALQIDYKELLVLAGHPLPVGARSRSTPKGSLLRTKLLNETLTPEEAIKLEQYLAFLRHQSLADGS